MNSLVLYTTEDGEIQLVLADGLYFNIYLKEKTATVVKGEQVFFGFDGEYLEMWYVGCYGGDIVIPETITVDGVEYVVTVIGDDAFACCIGLKSITIPNTIKIIESGSFRGCDMLTSIDIPSTVISIGKAAFASCIGLTSVVIPDSVREIQIRAFEYCEGLKSVELPKTDIRIDFQNSETFCKLIGRDYVHERDLYFSGANGSHSYLYEKSRLITIDNLDIKDESLIFKSCPKDHVGGFIIPDGVKVIGKYAFAKCEGLEYVIMPDSVIKIENDAFINCSNLEYVSFSKSLVSIGAGAFMNCRKLSGGTLPDTVKCIGHGAFESCAFSYIHIPNTIGTISRECFEMNGHVNYIMLPDSVGAIGDCAFSNCYPFYDVYLPESLTYIGDLAFTDCDELYEITIPPSVRHIGSEAFTSDLNVPTNEKCHRNLKRITCYAIAVPETADDAFTPSDMKHLTLYVPEESIADYSSKEPWCNFKEIKAIDKPFDSVKERFKGRRIYL